MRFFRDCFDKSPQLQNPDVVRSRREQQVKILSARREARMGRGGSSPPRGLPASAGAIRRTTQTVTEMDQTSPPVPISSQRGDAGTVEELKKELQEIKLKVEAIELKVEAIEHMCQTILHIIQPTEDRFAPPEEGAGAVHPLPPNEEEEEH